MASTAPNRLAEFRKRRKLTQQQLADLVGAHWITISKLERGIIRLSDVWQQRLAKALEIDGWELFNEPRPLPKVHVEGWIEEGGQVHPYDNDLEFADGGNEGADSFTIDTRYFTHPSFRWLVVAGDALWPLYQDGDRVCLWHVPEDEIENYHGRLCVAWYEDPVNKSEQVTVGVLDRGRIAGQHTVSRVGMPPLRDLKFTSLAVVAMAIYNLGPGSISEI